MTLFRGELTTRRCLRPFEPPFHTLIQSISRLLSVREGEKSVEDGRTDGRVLWAFYRTSFLSLPPSLPARRWWTERQLGRGEEGSPKT